MISLADAIIYHDLETVKSMVQQEEDLNIYDEYGFTPLIETTIMNKHEICEFVLHNQADPNMLDTTGRSALHWACDNNNLKIANLLLKHGADPNTTAETGQPALTFPLLRQQKKLYDLLVQAGANIEFAQNFIYAKLIGHRFHLTGKAHIINPANEFVLLDFEGFVSEFTLRIIKDSFSQYQTNYANRSDHKLAPYNTKIIKSLDNALDLTKFQHYSLPIAQYDALIKNRLRHKLLLMPVIYEGHAISMIRYKNWFAKCDRGVNSQHEGSINIYQILNPDNATEELWYQLLYKKQTSQFIHHDINQILGLKRIKQLPVTPQITGNCSWANIESSILVMLFLQHHEHRKSINEEVQQEVFSYYDAWLQWDKFRAVNEYIERYRRVDDTQKVTQVVILLAILFKMIEDGAERHDPYVKLILPIVKVPKYYYMVSCYLKHFVQNNPTPAGQKLKEWLEFT